MRFPKRLWARALLALTAAFLLIQVVPYGRSHTNPPVRAEPSWNSARTKELVRVACYDCHSNETTWPWYSHVAPFSWLVQNHVDEGREHLNFSEFHVPQDEAGEAAKEVTEGDMPPWDYLLMHPDARLSDGERQELIAGLRATFRARSRHDRDHDEDDD